MADAAWIVAQSNVDRAATASAELIPHCRRSRVQALALQEPYCTRDRKVLVGFEGARVVTGAGPGEFPGAAVVVLDEALSVLKLGHLCSSHMVVVELTSRAGRVYLVSLYCQYRHPIGPYLQGLDRALTELRGKPVIVMADVNARSERWWNVRPPRLTHRRAWDRGVAVEELADRHGLAVANQPGQPATFASLAHVAGGGGESNIDVTLLSPEANRMFGGDWAVQPTWSTSQHRSILLRLEPPGQLGRGPEPSGATPPPLLERLCLGKADWPKFRELLAPRVESLPPLGDCPGKAAIDTRVGSLTDAIMSSARAAIPAGKRRAPSVPWWTPALRTCRNDVRRAERAARSGPCASRCVAAEVFLRRRRAYQAEARKARRLHHRERVTREGAGDPWGRPYRAAMEKLSPRDVLSTVRAGTLTWEEAAGDLLNSLVPDDTADSEDDGHRETRARAAAGPSDMGASPAPFTEGEVKTAVFASRRKKAPGEDGVLVEFLREGWPVLSRVLTDTYSACLRSGYFPDAWKTGVVRALLKGGDRDPTDPKSYRPICLLSVLGKVLERLLAGRLSPQLEQSTAPEQYGFRPDRSTVEAIDEVRRLVAEAPQHYVLGVFLDIQGAFDNVWWPCVLAELVGRDCPPGYFAMVSSYLSSREVKMTDRGLVVRKSVTKGCPQGSVLGPQLWNLVFDGLLGAVRTEGFGVVAYADDCVVTITGNSRRELEARGQTLAGVLEAWSRGGKLAFSGSKSELMLLKGRLARPPIVKLGGASVPYRREVKYLGVVFQERLGLAHHAEAVAARATAAFGRVARLAGQEWGLRAQDLLVIYRGLFLGILLYAIGGFYDLLKAPDWRRFRSAQRAALVKVARSYRTVSHAAVHVVAGVLPIELEAARRYAAYRTKKGHPFRILGHGFEPGGPRAQSRQQVKELLLGQWQADWTVATTGRLTYKFFPSVRRRLGSPWVVPEHRTTQFLTGHGDFPERLHRLSLAERPDCAWCKDPGGSAEHVLRHCPEFREERAALEAAVFPGGVREDWTLYVSSPTHYSALVRFAVEALRRPATEPRRPADAPGGEEVLSDGSQ